MIIKGIQRHGITAFKSKTSIYVYKNNMLPKHTLEMLLLNYLIWMYNGNL